MANQAVQKFYYDTTSSATLVIPAGVTSVKVYCEPPAIGLDDISTPFWGFGWSSLFLIDTQRRLWAWGDNGLTGAANANGILGLNSAGGAYSIPQLVNVIQKWKQFFSSTNGAQLGTTEFGLDIEGGLWAWGSNTDGIVGVNTTQAGVGSYSSPQQVIGAQRWQRLFPGGGVAGANSQIGGIDILGKMWMWGNNTNGQLGTGGVVSASTPTLVLGGKTDWQYAVAQTTNTLALDLAGAAWSWGLNDKGQLGVGDVIPRSSPIAVLGGHVFSKVYTTPCKTTKALSASFGIDTAGALWAWGNNASGELGVGDVVARSSPVAVVGSKVFSKLCMTSNEGTVLGLATNGLLYGWGNNADGQLGNGDVTVRSSPTLVLGGLTFQNMWLRCSASLAHTTAYGLTTSGDLYSWGWNGVGIAVCGSGDGLTLAFSSPQLVVGSNKWRFVAPTNCPQNSQGAILGIDVNGQVWAWGDNTYGQCGQNSTAAASYSSPVAVLGIPHVWELTPPTDTYTIPVSPGSSYVVVVNGLSRFGAKPLGVGFKKVTVEYQQ